MTDPSAIATLQGQRDVLASLLRECLGPLEVSAAVIESDDAEEMNDLIARVKQALDALDNSKIDEARP